MFQFLIFSPSTQTPPINTITVKRVSKSGKWWSRSHYKIKMVVKIGKGAFGEVYEALWSSKKVAVKLCKSSNLKDKEEFMMEARVLKQYKHPNVIR